jgi:cytochrome c oxidase assembly protein subunit 15
LIPDGIDWSLGIAHTLTYDPVLVHFIHRWWAWVVVAVLLVFARRVRATPQGRPAAFAIHAALGTQVLLGIATVLTGVWFPLAALHQAVGASLVAATVWGAQAYGKPAQ